MLLPEDLRVRAAVLPAGQDPDDFLAEHGPEALRRLVDEAPSALDVAIRRAAASGVASPAEKADAVAALAPLLVKLSSPVERGAYGERLALAVGANPEDVRAAVTAQRRGEAVLDVMPIAPRVEPAEVRKLRLLAHSLVEHPHLAPRLRSNPLLDGADHPVVELIRRLVEAAGSDRRVDLEEVSDGLSEASRSILYALAADDHPPEEIAAAQTVDDVNRWLEDREARARQAELTERLRRGEIDPLEVLRAKARLGADDLDPPPPRERAH